MIRQNNYPLKDWHFEHVQKTILKYITGLSENEKRSRWRVKQHNKFSGNLSSVRRNIQDDIQHGVTREEVSEFLDKIQNDSSFADLRKIEGSKERFEELRLEKH